MARHFLPALLIGAFAVGSCTPEDRGDPKCAATFSHATQSGNTLNVGGHFVGGQPRMSLSQNGHLVGTIGATSSTEFSTSFDLHQFPPGVYSAMWLMSCYDEDEEAVIESSIPTVTLQ